MTSKKITDADKLEIARLYRQSGDTTASLASRYGVSNSTISRLLKTSIPGVEYEILIQQKRVSKVSSDEEIPTAIDSPSAVAPPEPERDDPPIQLEFSPANDDIAAAPILPKFTPDDPNDLPTLDYRDNASDDNSPRRVRRRSSAPTNNEQTAAASPPVAVAELEQPPVTTPTPKASVATEQPQLNMPVQVAGDTGLTSDDTELLVTPPKTTIGPPVPRTPVLRDILADSKDRYSNPPPPPPVATVPEESDEDDNESEDVNLLAAMFGEEIADDDDDDNDDDADLEDDDGDSSSSAERQSDRDRMLTEDRLNVQVKPLSQATLPRTCYIVIDKFAELIVRPLKDFADLGQISSEETYQRTLPVFDNHRVAKRFSNQRTQRVIKVPDSRIFHKTTQHLRLKGITCLLVDGNIYSLN